MAQTKQSYLTSCSTNNQLRMVFWIFLWSLSWVAVKWGIKNDWLPEGPVTIAAIGGTTVLGWLMIQAFRKFLAQSDELQRKIQLDALSFTLGITIIGTALYGLLETAMIVKTVELSNIILLISITYAASSLLINWRYQ